MLKNYFKVALRNLYRYKGFSFINILGLAIGITGCLLIGLFVWDEMQYDKFIKDGTSIYRLYQERDSDAGITATANTPPIIATHLKQQFPEVEGTTRILMWPGKVLMEKDEVRAYEKKGLIADSIFFSMFPLTFLKGTPTTAMDPLSIVLTEETAKKYFGEKDPIGQVLKIDKTDFAVKGVLASLPEHFHLDFNYIMPMSSAGIPADRMESWGWNQFFTYVKLKDGSNVEALQTKLQDAVKKHAADEGETEKPSLPYFQTLKDIHLGSANFEYDNAKRGNGTYVKGLTIIAVFVLLIACFNFINLATARSFRRAKEIGVRKVIGADRKQLIFQFTGETILLSLIAIVLAVGATFLILPALNSFTGKSISFNPFSNPLLGFAIFGNCIGHWHSFWYLSCACDVRLSTHTGF